MILDFLPQEYITLKVVISKIVLNFWFCTSSSCFIWLFNFFDLRHSLMQSTKHNIENLRLFLLVVLLKQVLIRLCQYREIVVTTIGR